MMPPLAPQTLLPEAGQSALLLVDLQERLVNAMPGTVGAQVARNAVILLETAKEFSLPVLVSEQYPAGLGQTLPVLMEKLPPGVAPQEKLAFSCCQAPTLQSLLKHWNGRSVIVCGIETHVCVLQTALDLLAQGNRVFVAADATASRSKSNWRLALNLLRQAGAVIGSTEMFAFGLLGQAGSDRFKRISKLVK